MIGDRLLHANYRRHSRLRHFFRRRMGKAGALALTLLFLSAVFGLEVHRTAISQLFTLLLALVLVAAAGSLVFCGRFRVSRRLPRFATAGEPCAYRLYVENLGARVERGLRLRERPAFRYPSLEEFRASREPDEEQRPWFDRKMKFRRWQYLMRRQLACKTEEVALPDLRPGEPRDLRMTLTPARRGILRIEGASLARPDPLGLFRAIRELAAVDSLVVLPRRYPVGAMELAGGRRYQPGGVALASRVGDSQEFMALREYRPGDPLRTIHWRSWARMGEPMVKEFQDEYFSRHGLVFDTFLGHGDPELFEEAVSVAASLACAVSTGESLLDLLFIGTRAYCFTAGRGLGYTDRLLELLASVRAAPDQDFEALRRLIMTRVDRLSSCLCVLLAWDEPRQELIEQLRARKIPLLVLVVSHAEPAFGGLAADKNVRPRWLRPDRIAEDLLRI